MMLVFWKRTWWVQDMSDWWHLCSHIVEQFRAAVHVWTAEFMSQECCGYFCYWRHLFSTVTIDYEVSLIRLLLCFFCTPWLSSCWTKCHRFVSHPVSTLCFTLFWIKITDSNFESYKATVAESKNEEMKLNEAVSAALYVSYINTVMSCPRWPYALDWLLFLTCISYWGWEAFFQVGVCFPVTMATNLWGSRVPL